MTDFYRIMVGAGSAHASEAIQEGWVGTGWLSKIDLSEKLYESKSDFQAEFNEVVLSADGITNKYAAGGATSATWTLIKQMKIGDVVISPNGNGHYRVGRISSDYFFAEGRPLPHRRAVNWLEVEIPKENLSSQLKSSISVPITLVWLNGYPQEIQQAYEQEILGFLNGETQLDEVTKNLDENISFVLEKYLEEFLVRNWPNTSLGKAWDLLSSQESNEAGRMDLLALSKDKRTYLVIELKLRRSTDEALGQVQRYMGWVQKNLAEPGQEVRGLIIASEKDQKLELALSVAPNVSFMKYELDFTLIEN